MATITTDIWTIVIDLQGFPDSSVGKESAYHA